MVERKSIQSKRQRLADGTERTYIYEVSSSGDYQLISRRDGSGSVSKPIYRKKELKRIVSTLQANSSLLVVGEAGCGKTFLANAVEERLADLGFVVGRMKAGTIKYIFLNLAEDLGVPTETLEGKALNTQELQDAIAEDLEENTAFLIADQANRLPVSIRIWLEKLLENGQPLLLLATYPPARDIFLKIPRIELSPLNNRAIREIMAAEAEDLGLAFHPGKLAELQQRTGGNPMLAKRVIREEYLGLDSVAYDHTQWIDGTPFLVAGLMCFVILRFLGLGFNSTSLYLLGGIMTVAVGIIRTLIYTIPKKSNKLGQ